PRHALRVQAEARRAPLGAEQPGRPRPSPARVRRRRREREPRALVGEVRAPVAERSTARPARRLPPDPDPAPAPVGRPGSGAPAPGRPGGLRPDPPGPAA